MNNEAEVLIMRLMDYYDVFTISELANKLNISQPSISAWKKNNYVKAIANKCRELKIYDKIFLQNKQIISNNSIGQVAQVVQGNQNLYSDEKYKLDDDIKKTLELASTIINEKNKESFKKCIKNWMIENI